MTNNTNGYKSFILTAESQTGAKVSISGELARVVEERCLFSYKRSSVGVLVELQTHTGGQVSAWHNVKMKHEHRAMNE